MKFKSFMLSCAASLIGFSFITAEMPENNSAQDQMLATYFPREVLEEVLAKHEVPQSEWTAIHSELSAKDREIIQLVEERAEKMDPNPLKNPKNWQDAVVLFRNTLKDVFANVMQEHGFQDQTEIAAILEDVQQLKAQQFASSLETMEDSALCDSTELSVSDFEQEESSEPLAATQE